MRKKSTPLKGHNQVLAEMYKEKLMGRGPKIVIALPKNRAKSSNTSRAESPVGSSPPVSFQQNLMQTIPKELVYDN